MEAFDVTGELVVPIKRLIAVGSSVSWERLTEAGNLFVFAFAMLIFATCVVALLHFGIEEVFPKRSKRAKQRRRKHHEWSTQR